MIEVKHLDHDGREVKLGDFVDDFFGGEFQIYRISDYTAINAPGWFDTEYKLHNIYTYETVVCDRCEFQRRFVKSQCYTDKNDHDTPARIAMDSVLEPKDYCAKFDLTENTSKTLQKREHVRKRIVKLVEEASASLDECK